MAKMKLKLVVDKKKNKVIFAEAKKDFVDLIIYFLSLPLSALVKYLSSAGSSSLGKLHSSIDPLMNAGYIKRPHNDRGISNPIIPNLLTYVPILPMLAPAKCGSRTLLNCKSNHRYVKDRTDKYLWCRFCSEKMSEEVEISESLVAADYVKEMVQYMVADDLSVSPLDYSSVSAALKGFDQADVVEKEVEFGSDEALELLNAALHSKEPLTSVFLKTETVPPTPKSEN